MIRTVPDSVPIDIWFAPPIDPGALPDVDALRAEIERALLELERRMDPLEFAACEALRNRKPRRWEEGRGPPPRPIGSSAEQGAP